LEGINNLSAIDTFFNFEISSTSMYYWNNGGKATCCTFSAAGSWTIYW